MTYSLKLSDGKSVELRFSMYFLRRMCELSGLGISSIYPYLIGDMSNFEDGIINGGLIDNIQIRSQVIAAGMEADAFYKGKSDVKSPESKEVYDILESVEGGIISVQWADVLTTITSTLTAELPKKEVVGKKKDAPKKISPGQK